jgi:CTP-dependent riboflavin kinase
MIECKSILKSPIMRNQLEIPGKIVSGAKQGAVFTQLEWVQGQCVEKLGFAPWPGTLNLEISMDRVDLIEELKDKRGLELVSPDANFCSGHVFPVSIEGVPGAVVLPAEDVRVHEKNIIEIIAPQFLKDTLSVQDGDQVTITIE